jgi:hypothetical protein
MALPIASDNQFPKLIVRESANDGSDFSNPSADYRVLFVGEDGDLHLKDSAGTVTDFPEGGGAGSTSGIAVLRHVYQRSSADYTTTSTSLVAVDATANTMSYDATVAANSRIKVEFTGVLQHSAAVTASFCVALDGTVQQGTAGLGIGFAAGGVQNGSFTWVSPQLAADTYTVAIYWARGSSGTFTMRADAARFATFAVYEIPA